MVDGPVGSNQTTLFGKSFQSLDVSGNNAFSAFNGTVLNPMIRVATTGAIQARADPATNTLFIDGPVSNPYIVSTGQYAFYQIKVTPQTSTITSTVQGFPGDFITASSPSTVLGMIGYNDIKLSTNVTTNSIFFTISTFTSKGYLDISAAAFGTFSTVSSLFVPNTVFNSSILSISTGGGISFSTLQSSINGLAISTGDQFYILTGLINARATIIQLNSEIADVNRNMRSTVTGLGSSGYVSTLSLTSTSIGVRNLNLVVSTLGSGNVQLYYRDAGKSFYYTGTTTNTVKMPDTTHNGWNVYVSLNPTSAGALTLDTTTPASLTLGSKGYIASDGSDFYFM
jgi:hypothetical protein